MTFGDGLPSTRGAQELSHFEDVAAFEPKEKLRNIPSEHGQHGVLEIVLHNAGDREIVDAFLDYARRHNARPMADRRRDVKGLTFLPVEADFDRAQELARLFIRPSRSAPAVASLAPNASTFGLPERCEASGLGASRPVVPCCYF